MPPDALQLAISCANNSNKYQLVSKISAMAYEKQEKKGKKIKIQPSTYHTGTSGLNQTAFDSEKTPNVPLDMFASPSTSRITRSTTKTSAHSELESFQTELNNFYSNPKNQNELAFTQADIAKGYGKFGYGVISGNIFCHLLKLM